MLGFEGEDAPTRCLASRSYAEMSRAASQNDSRLAARFHRARIAFSDVLDSVIHLVLELSEVGLGGCVWDWLGELFLNIVLRQLMVHKGVAQRPAPWSSTCIRLVRLEACWQAVDGCSHALPNRAPVERPCPIVSCRPGQGMTTHSLALLLCVAGEHISVVQSRRLPRCILSSSRGVAASI
jgi:hypothetical protein